MSETLAPPPDMVFSDFVKEKIRIWFKMMDTTKDGFMSKEDFELIANRFAEQYSLDENRSKEIYDWLVYGFKKVDEENACEDMEVVKQLSLAIQAGEKINEEQYIQGLGQLMTINPELARLSLHNLVSLFFKIFDFNEDGFITCEELEKGLSCFGYDNKEIVQALFKIMESGHEGKISQEEYVTAWMDFIFGNDKNNPMVKFFGPHLLE